jgi:hypothetical protein
VLSNCLKFVSWICTCLNRISVRVHVRACDFFYCPAKNHFEGIMVATARTPWKWRLWCAETCHRLTKVRSTYWAQVRLVMQINECNRLWHWPFAATWYVNWV